MEYNNISTNILRDESRDLNYVVTPNTVQIFERIFNNSQKTKKSFSLIGNYGTGKSTFLWALEKNLLKQRIYFSNSFDNELKGFRFLKIVGNNVSLTQSLNKTLKIDPQSSSELIIEELEKRRINADKKKEGLVIMIDEFGKFLEFIEKNKSANDLYLLQLIAEWANDETKNVYFIITLHQSFISYASSLDIQERNEWEKIKGRFSTLIFNEPIEQLLFFASKKLEQYQLPVNKKDQFNLLHKTIKKSGLIRFSDDNETLHFAKTLYPLDWLSANILVNALQRYGQNERSLFTFINDETEYAVSKFTGKFYSVPIVYKYLVANLTSEIFSFSNPHRMQWQTCFKALERAELIDTINYQLASELIQTICLVNIFSKAGSLFDKEFLKKYIYYTADYELNDIETAINLLDKGGIIRIYKQSHKLSYHDGTDIDIEQELANISKELNADFSIQEEINELINFPIIQVKKESFEKGTPRYFEFRILSNLNDIKTAEGVLDGYINLIFDEKITENKLNVASKNTGSNLFVIYKNSTQIKSEIFTINKLKKLIVNKSQDINAKKLIEKELQFHLEQLQKFVLDNLFKQNDQNIWYFNGDIKSIKSKKELNETLSTICSEIYSATPIFKNELINKEIPSSQITTARKALIKKLLYAESSKDLEFTPDKFPPEKSIYLTLLKSTGIHQLNEEFNYYNFVEPTEPSFKLIWNECELFIKSANASKRNLAELYDILSKAPYKIKKGFAEFWIPIFLIIKKEDFALFHETNGFVHYLSEDVFDLIHKSPHNYAIKSYDVSGLKINLLESYKELVQTNDVALGTKSTFLSIFGNFLRFYRGLNEYTIHTKKLSSKAIQLREAIKNAKDPEDALFNQFPNALGFHSISIDEDEEILKSYTFHIQDAIREIRTAFDVLLDRIEQKIIESFYCENNNFENYKVEIKERLRTINISLLGLEQSIFYKRLVSPLDDRNSWLKSVADSALGKSIDKMIDEEELLLVTNLEDYLLGLIKASELHEFKKSDKKMVSLQLFGQSGKMIKDQFILIHEETKEINDLKVQLKEKIATLDIHKRKQLLLELLATEMNENLII